MVDATIQQERCDFYVYVIFRPDGTPCYVGKGTGGRWKDHVKRSHNKALKAIHSASGGDLPIVKVRNWITEKESFETEMRLIVAIGRANLGDGPLVNLTDGGDGVSGYIPTKKEIERRRRAFLGNTYSKGRKKTPEEIEARRLFKHSPETRAKIGAAQLGKKYSPDIRAKMSAAKLGWKPSPEAIAKTRAANLGRKHSPETREKVRAAKLGGKYSPEARAKMRVGALERWAISRAKTAGPWLIDPGPEYRARAVLYHEDARRTASQPAEQLALDL
jgi:hypothetical protein